VKCVYAELHNPAILRRRVSVTGHLDTVDWRMFPMSRINNESMLVTPGGDLWD
jgi:hypothetical protein